MCPVANRSHAACLRGVASSDACNSPAPATHPTLSSLISQEAAATLVKDQDAKFSSVADTLEATAGTIDRRSENTETQLISLVAGLIKEVGAIKTSMETSAKKAEAADGEGGGGGGGLYAGKGNPAGCIP